MPSMNTTTTYTAEQAPVSQAVDHFCEQVAARYDEHTAEMFDPAVVDPAVDFLAELAGEGAALEFAIGTGRIALPLAGRGVPVQGIDLSEAMLAKLHEKPGGDRIPVTVGDNASTRVEGGFALVYLVFNTIPNLTSQAAQVACFRNAAAHLEPGGCFVVEVRVPQLRLLPPGHTFRASQLSERCVGIDEYDTASQRMTSHHYRLSDGQVELRSIPVRYVWPSELDLTAQLARHDAARALGRLDPRAVHRREPGARVGLGAAAMSTVTVRTSQPSRQATTVRAIATGSVQAAIAGLFAVEFYAVLLLAAGVSLRARAIGAQTAQPVSYGSFAGAVLLAAFWGSIATALVARKARHPRRTFAVVAAAAVALSLVFPLAAEATTVTKLALAGAHLLAAAVMLPAFLRQFAATNAESSAEPLVCGDVETTATPLA
jgi:hypothetical protein